MNRPDFDPRSSRPVRPPWQRRRRSAGLLAVMAVTALTLTGCSTGTPAAAPPSDSPAVASASPLTPTSPASPTAPPTAAPTLPTPEPATAAPPVSSDAPWAAPSEASLPSDVAATLQSMLDGWVGTSGIPGMAAAVVTPDGSWSGAAGADAAGAKIVTDSAFGIGSTTKPFTAAEVLLLASQGKVDLDAPVTDYVDLPFDTGGATVRQVATMTSGFPLFPPDPVLQPLVAKDPGRTWTARDVIELGKDEQRVGTLGGPSAYNGMNYLVLSLLVEKVTGMPLAEAVRRDLLGPADIDRLWSQPDEQPGEPRAVAVAPDSAAIVDPADAYLPSLAAASAGRGAAGMAADAPSLARAGYLLYGGRMIDPSLVTTMTSGDPSVGAGYGFGTMLADEDGARIVGHAGDFMGYSSILLVWPSTRTAVAVLAPRQGAAVDGTLPGWAFRLYGALPQG